ncbi:tripartite motif-containing protein 2-like [Patiria miniata]|uniref:Uncharacterized protein n=1 Tax=Patiria miniata TaxID=46514 RepID=A0A913ZRQ3_PATMI|nr:tripartite motif-containing protein 2-like [Patiria miniata]
MLDCQHSFCFKCLEKMMSTNKIVCPVCRTETLVADDRLQSLSPNFLLIYLVDEMNKQQQLIGEQLSTKKDHRIIPAHELDTSRVLAADLTDADAPKCRKHGDHAICFHCETCNMLICSKCAILEHRGDEHNCVDIADSMKSFRTSVTDILQNFGKNKQKFTSTEQSIERARNRLQCNVAQACSDISSKAEEEIAKIRNKAERLTARVKKLGQERDSEYRKAFMHNRDQMERGDQIVTAVNDLMRQCDDFELLELEPKVMHHLELQKELKCEPVNHGPSFIGVQCQRVVINQDLGKVCDSEKWQLKGEFGKRGTGDGEFEYAVDVACFSNGDIAVTDTTQKRLSLFTSTGQFKSSVPQGPDCDQLNNPWRVAVSSEDLLFVTDKKKVKVFDAELEFVCEFTEGLSEISEIALTGIAVDNQRVAVADDGRKIISVHNLNGSLIAMISNEMVKNYVAISNKEHLIFTNYQEKRMLCVDFEGSEVFNVMTELNGEPASPTGVLCDDDDSIYVAVHESKAFGADEVQKYDSGGAFTSTVAHGLHMPFQMAFTPAGDVVIADKHSVKIFERM